MSRLDNLYSERSRLNGLIQQARRKIEDLEDDPTSGMQNAINQYEQDIRNLQGGVNSINEDIAAANAERSRYAGRLVDDDDYPGRRGGPGGSVRSRYGVDR